MTDWKFDGVQESKWPEEVWRAVEGDCEPLIALLRSGRPLSQRTRLAMAAWLADELKPVQVSRGRPPSAASHPLKQLRWSTHRGHDVATELGRAGYRYLRLRKQIERVGRNLKAAGNRYWSGDRTLAAVALWAGVDNGKLADYLKRGPGKRPDDEEWNEGRKTAEVKRRQEAAELERRQEIAREVSRTRNRQKSRN